MNYYPKGADSIKTIDSLLQHLIMLSGSSSKVTNFYYNMRELYTDEVDIFLQSIKACTPRKEVITI